MTCRFLILATLMAPVSLFAKTTHFNCGDSNKHRLQIEVDAKYLNVKSESPTAATIQFVLDGQTYTWGNAQFLGISLGDGQFGTFFTTPDNNVLYVEVNDDKPFVELNLKSITYSLACSKN